MASSDEEDPEPTITHRRTRRTQLSNLSEELVIDILLRLPLKCLMRSKGVSKVWYDLITSPHFVSTFSSKNRANEVTIYCQARGPSDPTDTSSYIAIGFHSDILVEFSVPLAVMYPRIVGCSDGLVCLSFSRKQDKFLIWNPATRHSRLIPDANFESTRYGFLSSGFCYDPVAHAHKISRLEICTGPQDLQATLRVKLHEFSLSSNSWIEKRELFIPFQTGSYGLLYGGLTCVGKFLFWTSELSQQNSLRHGLQHGKCILCFDMVEGLFTRIEFPCPALYRSKTRIASYKGTIAVFLWRAGPPFDIWVLNDCGGPKQSWSLQQIRTPSPEKFDPITYFSKDGVDFLLVRSSSGHLLWNPQSGETIANLGITHQLGGYAAYSESLASVR